MFFKTWPEHIPWMMIERGRTSLPTVEGSNFVFLIKGLRDTVCIPLQRGVREVRGNSPMESGVGVAQIGHSGATPAMEGMAFISGVISAARCNSMTLNSGVGQLCV